MIAVVDYGIGNLRSAEKALVRVGADAQLVADPAQLGAADAVVLPGVGAFGRCRAALADTGFDVAVCEAVAAGLPLLGICIGMQLLYEGSEEAPGVDGLGLLPGTVRRLSDGVKRPQMQWNRLRLASGAGPLLAGSHFEAPAAPWVYFVHSYAAPAAHASATCDYGGPVTAVVEHGRIGAVQFHPEKSGPTGLALLANFAATVARGA